MIRVLVDEAGEAVLAIGTKIEQLIATYSEIGDTRIDNEVVLDYFASITGYYTQVSRAHNCQTDQ
jgi:hypothetical protein